MIPKFCTRADTGTTPKEKLVGETKALTPASLIPLGEPNSNVTFCAPEPQVFTPTPPQFIPVRHGRKVAVVTAFKQKQTCGTPNCTPNSIPPHEPIYHWLAPSIQVVVAGVVVLVLNVLAID